MKAKHIVSFVAVLFYLNSPIAGRPNERRIIKVVLDNQQFVVKRSLMSSHSTIPIDETDLRNQDAVIDIFGTLNERDFRGLDKYYVDASTQVWRRGGWRPRRFGSYTPTADIQVAFVRSQERSDFEDNVQQAIARLGTIATQSTNAEIRDIATILRRYIRFDLRRERPN